MSRIHSRVFVMYSRFIVYFPRSFRFFFLIEPKQCFSRIALCLLFVFEVLGSDYCCFPCLCNTFDSYLSLHCVIWNMDLVCVAILQSFFCTFEAAVGDTSDETVKLRSGVLVAYLLFREMEISTNLLRVHPMERLTMQVCTAKHGAGTWSPGKLCSAHNHVSN